MVLLLKYGVNIMETPKSKSYTVYTYQVLLKPLGKFSIFYLNFPHGDWAPHGKGLGLSFLIIPGNDFVSKDKSDLGVIKGFEGFT